MPAAHMVFMAKSWITRWPSSSATMIILASSPPMSMMVRASGQKWWVPRPWAMTSLTEGPPRMSASRSPPMPVKAARRNGLPAETRVPGLPGDLRRCGRVSPRWRRYSSLTTSPAGFIITRLTLTEPTSSPTSNLPCICESPELRIVRVGKFINALVVLAGPLPLASSSIFPHRRSRACRVACSQRQWSP